MLFWLKDQDMILEKKMVLKGGNIRFVFVYIYIGWVYIIEIKFLKDLNWFLFEND